MKRAEILREKIVRLVPLLTGMSIRVTQAGASAYVERDPVTLRPNRVNLPYVPDDASDALINAIEGFVDHEVGHCLFTGEHSWQQADAAGVLSTWNAVEDVFVERKIVEMFPGSKSNLAKLRTFFINNYSAPQVEKALSRGEDPRPYLMVCAYRAWAGQQTFVDYMADKWALLGDIPKLIGEYCKQTLPDIETSEQAVEIAIEIKKRLKQQKPEPPPMPPEEPDNEPEQQTGGKGETPEEEGEGPSDRPNDNQDENSDGAPDNADEDNDSESQGGGGQQDPSAEKSDSDEDDTDADNADEDDAENSGEQTDSEVEPNDETGGDEEDDSEGESSNPSESAPSEESQPEGDTDDGDGSETQEEQGNESEPSNGDSQGGNDAQAESEPNNADEDDDAEAGVSAQKEGNDTGDSDEGDNAESGEDSPQETDGNDDPSQGESGTGDDGGTPESEEPEQSENEEPLDASDEYHEQENMEILDANEDDTMPGGGKGNADIQPSTAENPGVMPVEEEIIEPIDFEAIENNMEDFDDSLSDLLTTSAFNSLIKSQYKVFSRDYDYIGPLTDAHVKGVTDTHVLNMTNTVDSMLGPMQKDLERLIEARSRVVWTGGHKKGKLNATSLSRLVVSNDPRVFKQKQPARSKSVAVGILGDLSGSMYGNKVKTAAYSMYGLAKVLDKMQIPVEVLGFTTTDDEDLTEGFVEDIQREQSRMQQMGMSAKLDYSRYLPLFMPVIKSFNQRMTPEVIKHMAAVASAGWLEYNVDGECVQIAANRLMQRREDRKILFVLSDGSPASAGSPRAVLNEHLRQTVRDIEKSGIEIVGIGIEDDSVRKFYPKSVVIDSVSKLPSLVMGKMKEFLSQN